MKVRSPDGDTEYFDIVAGVLQGDTLAPYLFIICLDYVLRTSIDKIWENGFELTKKKRKRYPAKTIRDADYADELALLANTPNQAETLLHSLERAAAGIGLHVNAHKTEHMCYNQTGNIINNIYLCSGLIQKLFMTPAGMSFFVIPLLSSYEKERAREEEEIMRIIFTCEVVLFKNCLFLIPAGMSFFVITLLSSYEWEREKEK